MSIVILNTGCANLSSVKWAIQRLGYRVLITKNTDCILKSKKLLIPGVGTAQTAMQYLHENSLIDIIKSYKNPVLGICLGLQLFGSFSTEGNKKKVTNALQIIDEPVSLLKADNLPLPHIGWNRISVIITNHFLFKGISKKSRFYFLHSYAMNKNKYTIASSYYGQFFTAVFQKDNFFGAQFHPERSGKSGSIFLKNFLEI